MKATFRNAVIRYRKEELDAMEKVGRMFIDTTFDPGRYACEVAVIIAPGEELRSKNIRKGDTVIVDYLVQLDSIYKVTDAENKYFGFLHDLRNVKRKVSDLVSQGHDRRGKYLKTSYDKEIEKIIQDKAAEQQYRKVPNQYFLETQPNGDELRWCFSAQIYGVWKDQFVPMKGFVFCEEPEEIPEYKKGKLFIAAQKQNTARKAFYTRVKYINPEDEQQLDVHPGDIIFADRNCDIPIKMMGTILIKVPAEKILIKRTS